MRLAQPLRTVTLSGVITRRRGPFVAGDQVQLTEPKGRRHLDRLQDGRTIHTVFYTRAGQRIGYAIAADSPLSVDGGRTVTRNGVRMRVLHTGDATIVTWLRAGHTCILAARHIDPDVLLELAARPA